jgi:hypothetical protein
MKLQRGKQYKLRWIDAFGSAQWNTDEDLEKLIIYHEAPIEQTLYFIKSSSEFHIFTSGKPEDGRSYIDIHGIPKNWIISIKQVK